MSRVGRFALVGASGVLVNLGVLAALSAAGTGPRLASAGAIAVSIATNFLLNRGWTWADRAQAPALSGLARYAAVAGVAALVQWGLAVTLQAPLGALPGGLMLAQLGGIAAGTVVNFVGNDRWTFAPVGESPPERRWPWWGALGVVLAIVLAVQAGQMERQPMPPPSSHRTWLLVPRILHFFQGYAHRKASDREPTQLSAAVAYYTLPTRDPVDWTDPSAVWAELAPGGRMAQLFGDCELSYFTCLPHGYAVPAAVGALFPQNALLVSLVPTFYLLFLLLALYGIGAEVSGRPAGLAAAAIAAGYPGLFGMARWPEGYIITSALATGMVWCLLRSKGLTRWLPLLPFCALGFTAIRTGEGFSEAAGAGLAVGGPFLVTVGMGLVEAIRARRVPWRWAVGLGIVGVFFVITTDWRWVEGSLFQMRQGVDEEAMAARWANPRATEAQQTFIRYGLYAYFLVSDYLRPPLVACLVVATPFLVRARHRLLLLSWFLVAFAGYSFMVRKAIWYPIPMLPPLAAITAVGLAAVPWTWPRRLALLLAGVLGLHQLVTFTVPGAPFGFPRAVVRPYPANAVKVRWVDLAATSAPDTMALTRDARLLLRWIDANLPATDELKYVAVGSPWGEDNLQALRLGWLLTLERPDLAVIELATRRYVEGQPYEGLGVRDFALLLCVNGRGRIVTCGPDAFGKDPPPAYPRMLEALQARAIAAPKAGVPFQVLEHPATAGLEGE